MIVLDLEWNQPFGGRRMEEIIQIGAVRLARPGGPVVDAFNAHIRPSIYRKLSPVAKKLPESAQALTSELDFPAAYQAFLDWCGEDTLWAEWGAQDHGVLAANAAYWKLPAPPVTACIDLQAAFCRTLEIGLGRRIALEQAAEYCGLPLIYEFHNALHDALYAALITAWLTESSLLPTVPRAEAKHKRRRGVKFSRETYPKQPRQKITPLPEREQLLNSRQARIVPCPLCRQPGAVESWYPQGDVYYGVFRCENHGLFPVRMSVVHREDGSWQGRRVVPPLTDPERAAFAAAHREAGKGIFENLLKTEELNDRRVYRRMQTQTALIRADGGIELHAETAVDLHPSAVVHPAHAKLDKTLRFDDTLDHTGGLQVGTLFDDRLDGGENLLYGLHELRLVAVLCPNVFQNTGQICVHNLFLLNPCSVTFTGRMNPVKVMITPISGSRKGVRGKRMGGGY